MAQVRSSHPGKTTDVPGGAPSLPSPSRLQLRRSLLQHDYDAQASLLSPDGADPLAIAAAGTRGGRKELPHREAIQASFGSHDLSNVEAHVGGAAATASEALGARAYASGSAVAFASAPDLHTAAHEAAHVVQQRGGVQLEGGVGESGDRYERHADQVADAVVAGRSAEGLLAPFAPAGGGAQVQRVVQRDAEAWLRNTRTFKRQTRHGKGKRSTLLKVVDTAITNLIGENLATGRVIRLNQLIAAITAWEDSKMNEDDEVESVRAEDLAELKAEAIDERNFAQRLEGLENQVASLGHTDEMVLAIPVQIQELKTTRYGAHPVYQGILTQLDTSPGMARVGNRRQDIDDMNGRIDLSFGDLRGAPAADVFARYTAFLKGGGMQYSPTVTGCDVLLNPAGPADCSSVAQGLVRVLERLGIQASRIDCGTQKFLTTALGGDALEGNSGWVTDTTNELPGRRYWFPTHYVVNAPGGPFCGVVGQVWNAGQHIAAVEGGSASDFQVLGDHEGFTLARVLEGDRLGIAHRGDEKRIVHIQRK